MHAWNIDSQLEDLSEDELKAVAHHIRKHDSDPISLCAATVADRKLEIMERHRTGRGAWFAVVQAVKWNPLDKFGKTDFLASVKSGSPEYGATNARRACGQDQRECYRRGQGDL